MKDMLGPRFGAFAIDYLVFFAAFISHTVTFGQKMPDGGYQTSGLAGLFVPTFWLLWFVIPEWLWGATVGKKILGLKVQKADGGRLAFGSAILRRVCDLFDFWMCFGLVATICHLKTAKGQRVGDMAAGAVVVLAKKEANQISQPTPSGVADR